MQANELKGANFCTTSGLLTATGAETVHDTTVTISFCIDGEAYTKTAITDGATPTTDGNTGAAFVGLSANQGSVFVWGLNASGTVSVRQGSVEDLDAAGDFIVAPQFPAIPDSVVPFAYQVIEAGSTLSGTFDFGVDNWNMTGLTSTISNVMTLPSRPKTA